MKDKVDKKIMMREGQENKTVEVIMKDKVDKKPEMREGQEIRQWR
jgi:hypothetical protein